MKKCVKCNKKKDFCEFHKNKNFIDGYKKICKNCISIDKQNFYKKNKERLSEKSKIKYLKESDSIKKTNLEYYKLNRNIISTNRKNYRDSNPEIIKRLKKEDYVKNKSHILEYQKEYRQNNKEKIAEYKKQYDLKNPHIRAWRSSLKSVLRRFNKKKEKNTVDILGYSALELKNHIEKLFTEDMTWDNYGEWHIDHIKPVSTFDKNTDIKIVNALSNLQPLWWYDNLSKGFREA